MNRKRKNTIDDNQDKNNLNNKGKSSSSSNSNSYFSRGRKKRKQYMKIIIPSIVGVIVLGIALSLLFPGNNATAKYGNIGSAHEHAALWVNLNGTKIDFAQPKYMVRSNYIHMESYNGTLDGTTLHKHATNVPIGEFLKSVRMDISNGCLITDNGTRYCNNDNLKLSFFVNGNQTQDIMNYVLNDDDRILVIYGNQSAEEIQNEIQELNRVPINKL
ncbi:MAG: hypothetical protein M3162_01750 [Thermoproteota archaeon]|nr:hypothetical protein [Thermoproteota archaeon]